ncbi:MAG TPA: adenylate/guanylate cyclase domain-containing protein [Geminicoccaceae bacterium]|nr:adenylate/guanylate cyclase domain-containing protein [Geminicoccaceae bacterium]
MTDRTPRGTPSRLRLSIGAFLTLGLGGLVAVPLLVVFLVTLGTAFSNTQALLTDKAHLIIGQIVERTHGYLAPAEAVPRFIGDLVDQRRIDPDDAAEVGNAIRYAFAAAPQLKSLAFVHAGGWMVEAFREPERGLVGVERGVWRESPVMRAIVEDEIARSNVAHWSPPRFVPEIGVTLVSFVRPVLREGRFLGAMVAAIQMRDLSGFVRQLGGELRENCFILYGRDHVLAHRNLEEGPLPVSRSQPLPRLGDVQDPVLTRIWAAETEWRSLQGAAADDRHRVDGRQVDGRAYIFLYAPLELSGSPEPWLVGGYVPAEQVNVEFRRVIMAGVTGVAALLLATIGALLLGRGLSRPITALARASDAVGRLELEGLEPLPRSRLAELDRAAGAFDNMVVALRLFARYVPRRLVQGLIERGEAGILPPQEREATIMFTDIVGFTTMTDRMPAEDCARFLNGHLGLLTACVEAEDGIVDKFIGDAVMAFWLRSENRLIADDAEHAVRAALRMRDALAADNRRRAVPLRVRIGIHSGPVIVGDIGAATRVNFTIVGSAVNIAQRIEALNKVMGTGAEVAILMSAATARHLPPALAARSLGPHRLRGHHEPVELFTIDQGPIDRGPIDRGPIDRGPIDRGPIGPGPC